MKLRIVANILIIPAIIIIQTSILPVLFLAERVPDIILMWSLAWLITAGFRNIFWWLVSLGIIFDLTAYNRVGITVIPLITITYLANFFSRRFLVENRGLGIVSTMLMVTAATLAGNIFYFISNWLINLELPLIFSLTTVENFFLKIIYNIILFYLCFFLLRKINRQRIEELKLSLTRVAR